MRYNDVMMTFICNHWFGILSAWLGGLFFLFALLYSGSENNALRDALDYAENNPELESSRLLQQQVLHGDLSIFE